MRHMGMPPGGGQPQRQEKPYAKLSNSGRANMMKWVLERSPYVQYSKVDPFIELFEANEPKYMSSPDELFRFMTDYFGPQAGKIAFNQTCQSVTIGHSATNLPRILPDHLCVMTDHRLPFLEIRLTQRE
jgi:hypothetical protein